MDQTAGLLPAATSPGFVSDDALRSRQYPDDSRKRIRVASLPSRPEPVYIRRSQKVLGEFRTYAAAVNDTNLSCRFLSVFPLDPFPDEGAGR